MKTAKTFEIEIERHNVTPAQFLTYLRSMQKKHPEMCGDFDLNMFSREGWSFNYSNALPSERPCESERGTDKPFEKQTYIRNFDGTTYNEIIEFQFDDEKTGHGYYYTVQIDVADEDREANTSENVAAIIRRRAEQAGRQEVKAEKAEQEANEAERRGYAAQWWIDSKRTEAATLRREAAETRAAIKATQKAQEAPQTVPAAEAEQQPTETENAPEAATQAAQGTDEKKEAETMTTTEREALERINARQNAANLFTNIGPEEIAAELAAMEAEQAAPAPDPDAATLAPADAACVWDEDGNTITPEETTTNERKEEENTMKPTTTPEAAAILAINPAIFKGLHIKLGFDFQQPVTIRRIPAPFTIKKAWKLAGADHDPATSTAAIIMRDTGNTWGIYRDVHMAPITADNLRDDYDDHMSYSLGRAHGYKTVFSTFYAKASFHDLRKSQTCEAWIIAQHNDLLKPWTEPARDWAERQRDMTPGEHKQHRTYYNNAPAAILIDKSNYRVDNRRFDLKRRAAKLRADRQKAAADDATRATATRRYNDLLKAFNDAKQRIITALVNVDPLTLSPATVAELETIGKAIGEYAWKGLSGAARDINQFEAAARDNKFTTPARYDAAYNEILEKLAAILPKDANAAKEAV